MGGNPPRFVLIYIPQQKSSAGMCMYLPQRVFPHLEKLCKGRVDAGCGLWGPTKGYRFRRHQRHFGPLCYQPYGVRQRLNRRVLRRSDRRFRLRNDPTGLSRRFPLRQAAIPAGYQCRELFQNAQVASRHSSQAIQSPSYSTRFNCSRYQRRCVKPLATTLVRHTSLLFVCFFLPAALYIASHQRLAGVRPLNRGMDLLSI